LTSWVRDGTEKIFVSNNAIFNGVKAIRGGIPLVFPQFGRFWCCGYFCHYFCVAHVGQPLKTMPQHGFARTSNWEVLSLETIDAQNVKARLFLASNNYTLAVWPHEFTLEYEVHLSATSLICTLTIKNSHATDSFECHSLLHTYFSINDITSLEAEGFANRSFVDKMADCAMFTEERAQATIDRETDRVYIGDAGKEESGEYGPIVATYAGAATRDRMSVLPRAHIISVDGSRMRLPCDVVFWNPWVEKARSLPDLGEESYPRFVCIEPGTVNEWVTLGAGQILQLSQVLE
jgi:glucose-6-phosphate 1-epimerase